MEIYREILENFRDLIITKQELISSIPEKLRRLPMNQPVEIRTDHVIKLLLDFKGQSLSEQTILEWVNIVWFSGWFEYSDLYSDSIASVLNELEEIDEEGKVLTLEKVELYLDALEKILRFSSLDFTDGDT